MKKVEYLKKQAFQFLRIFIVFWIGSQFFPKQVSIQNSKTLIIASVLMVLMGMVYGVAYKRIFRNRLKNGDFSFFFFMMFVSLFLSLFITSIKLLILNKYLSGFEVNGFWTYVIITFAVMSFKFEITKKAKVNLQEV